MYRLSAYEFLLWEKKQLLKGGSKESLSMILESYGGITFDDINLIRLELSGNLYLKENLFFIENIWKEHILTSIPVQYLCGYSYWRNLKLIVSDKVLIPRPEKGLIFAELGTGSGAISIALALAKPTWQGFATDIDKDVIEIASKNFKNSSNQSNLRFCCGHWWNPLENFRGKLDLVFSNPPYIPKDTYEKLPKEVKDYEPKIALLGGEDGLLHIREIIQNAPMYLKNKGWLIIENHFDQSERVRELFLKNGFTAIEIINDYSGVGRFTIGRYK